MSADAAEAMRSFTKLGEMVDWRHRKCTIMLHAFFDESGQFTDSDFVCLCGYMAEDKAWDSFITEWRAALWQYKIDCVHMKDLMRLEGEYSGKNWTDNFRDQVVSHFIQIIRKNAFAGFGVALDSRSFRALASRRPGGTDKPHYFCFQRILRRTVSALKEWGYEGTVAVMFDDHQEYSQECYRQWSMLRARNPELAARIPSITFADDKVFYPLQGADMLAWLTNKYLREQLRGSAAPEHFMEILKSSEPGFGFEYKSELWDKAALENLVNHGKEPNPI